MENQTYGNGADTASREGRNLTLKDIWFLCSHNWKWFVISLALCLLAATFYILKTTPVYSRNASVLIKEDRKSGSVSSDISSAFTDLGFGQTRVNVNNEIINFCYTHDMRDQENYDHISQLVDIDSLIDWSLLQAYFGNYDLASGNLRYVRDINGGKWKMVLYDLDICFLHPVYCMNNVFRFESQIAEFNVQLVRNEEYREKFLKRAAEAYSSVLTLEHALERIDEFCEIVAPEVERDSRLTHMSPQSWRNHVNDMKNVIIDNNWIATNIQVICEVFSLSEEEREMYFGELLK